MADKLDHEHRALIWEIEDDDEPLTDHYGRVTYFYIMIGGEKLPVYQPGSVMFESGVKSDSGLNVVAGGSQQNGAILGNGCAVFLAKFQAKL